jgi:MoaA/NifB/PqqE/SkfB family radical SAM enzyme
MILDPREQKRRLLLRLKGVESQRPLIGPATVNLHLTDLCNIACKYCWYWGPGSALRPTGKNHLPFDLFEKLAQDFTDLQVDTIHLSGEGDPTLHPRFYDILRFLEDSFTVRIFSNATFPIERSRDILRADYIVINLGAADRKSYRDLVGRDYFIKVIKNIRELARLRPVFNPDFKMEVVFIENSLNKENMSKTEDLVRKLGVDLVQRKVVETSEHNRYLSDRHEKTEPAGEWPPCYHGWFYSTIRMNGDVNVCCFTRRLKIGNIYTTPFKAIWESDGYSRARASALSGGEPFRNFQECINCSVAARNKEIDGQMKNYNQVQRV